MQDIVDDQIEALLEMERPVDLVQELALPVATLVMCELLGVPYASRIRLHGWFRQLASRTATAERRTILMGELERLAGDLIEAKHRHPAGDLLSRWVIRHQEAGLYDREGLSRLALAFLTAGHETTAGMITLGMRGLLENPVHLAALRDDPSLVAGAAEAMVRLWVLAGTATLRRATDDIEIGDVVIRRGESILVPAAADTEDLGVPDLRRHVQELARLQLETISSTLLTRLPGLRLTQPQPRSEHDTTAYGLPHVTVTW
ncbi:putative cytochrome P450 hydroxylase [[Actinomadura] parvosata subsp. kistnae]|nr:putative cytochrome P450 hydroxylase [Actinomadura parvosata subsp. kistnae]